jgi:NAD(P)-dependent dehydrogenase (short-subunit alcohol dehydrogenase family)
VQCGRLDHEAADSGKIITVSSVAGTAPSAFGGYAHYGAAKADIKENYGELDGKMAILTGAQRAGLGRAYAKRLAGVGCEGRGG